MSHTASLALALDWSIFSFIPFPSSSVLVHAHSRVRRGKLLELEVGVDSHTNTMIYSYKRGKNGERAT